MDPRQLAIARAQRRLAGLDDIIALELGDVAHFAAPAQPPGARGMVVTNPPYGARIGGGDAAIQALMATLGRTLGRLGDWHAHVLVADPEMGFSLGLRAHRTHALTNGPLSVTLLHLDIPATRQAGGAAGENKNVFAGARAERVAMVANRLRKNQRRLAPYLRAQDITAYRLYDADLPEYAAAIDIYTEEGGRTKVHVQEYAPPAAIPCELARARLRDVLAALGGAAAGRGAQAASPSNR